MFYYSLIRITGMQNLMVVLVLLVTLGSPALAMESMSNGELKKTTAQIATPAGHAAGVSSPAVEVGALVSKLIESNDHVGNLTTALNPVGDAQTTTTPVREFIVMVNDANNFKSAVSLGFF